MLFGKGPRDDDVVVSMLAAARRRDLSRAAPVSDRRPTPEDAPRGRRGAARTLRETARLLSADGPGRTTEDELRDIILARAQVETVALALAIQTGGADWLARVIGADRALRRAEAAAQDDPRGGAGLTWDDASRAFFATLAEASGSPRLIALQRRFHDRSRRFGLALLRGGRLDLAARAARRRVLLQAVLARDVDAATALLKTEIEADLTADARPAGAATL